jgi:predicted nucleotidyltransferase
MAESDEQKVAALARTVRGLSLLLLYGSRARGDDHSGSDWDLGYLAGPDFDAGDDFLARLVLLLGTDRIDLVDLDRTNGLLRYRAAAEGRPLFESGPGKYERFWIDAVSYWCDMGPIIQEGYEAILAGLATS